MLVTAFISERCSRAGSCTNRPRVHLLAGPAAGPFDPHPCSIRIPGA